MGATQCSNRHHPEPCFGRVKDLARILKGLLRENDVLRFDDFAAAEAGGADADPFGGRAHFGVHRPQIYVPAPLGNVMGVADVVSELRPLAAEFTYLCHGLLQVSSELDL
jgi:hypothetical protein